LLNKAEKPLLNRLYYSTTKSRILENMKSSSSYKANMSMVNEKVRQTTTIEIRSRIEFYSQRGSLSSFSLFVPTSNITGSI